MAIRFNEDNDLKADMEKLATKEDIQELKNNIRVITKNVGNMNTLLTSSISKNNTEDSPVSLGSELIQKVNGNLKEMIDNLCGYTLSLQNDFLEMEKEKEKLQEQLSDANKEKTELQKQLDKADEEKTELQKQLDKAEEEKTELQKQLGKAEEEKAELQKQLANAEDKEINSTEKITEPEKTTGLIGIVTESEETTNVTEKSDELENKTDKSKNVIDKDIVDTLPADVSSSLHEGEMI